MKLARLPFLLALCACGSSLREPDPLALEKAPATAPLVIEPLTPLSWPFWEGVPVPTSARSSPDAGATPAGSPEFPFDPTAAFGEVWTSLPISVQELVRMQGFGGDAHAAAFSSWSALYGDLRAHGIPYTVTLDALIFVTHLAFEDALADLDDRVLGPSLLVLLSRMDARLLADGEKAHPDLRDAFDIARGVVKVALYTLDPSLAPPAALEPNHSANRPAGARRTSTFLPGPTLPERVRHDLENARSGAPSTFSAVLEANLDFSSMKAPASAGPSAKRARAMAWLSGASLMLLGRTERGAARADIDIAEARLHTRAALLLAHAVSPAVDPEAARAFAVLDRASRFVLGEPFGTDTTALEAMARRLGQNVASTAWMENVVSIDRLRHEMARARVRPDAAARDDAREDAIFTATAHLFGARIPSDIQVIRSLAAADRPPTVLDLASWLGSPDARTILHERGDDAPPRYESKLEALYLLRPQLTDDARHEYLGMSWLDAIGTYLAPSALESPGLKMKTPAWRRRRLEVGLAAWTLFHRDTSFSAGALRAARVAEDDGAPRPPPPSAPILSKDTPRRPSGFVEPHPEAIAKLLGFVRQFSRGFSALGGLPEGSSSFRLVSAVDDLLSEMLDAAIHDADDESPALFEADAMSRIPERLYEIEELSHAMPNALTVPLLAPPFGQGDVLEAVRGPFPLVFAHRERATHRTFITVGGSLAHYEVAANGAAAAALTAGLPSSAREDFASSYIVPEKQETH